MCLSYVHEKGDNNGKKQSFKFRFKFKFKKN